MSKLPKKYAFIDLSDYGRPIARVIASSLVNTKATPIHVTIGFIISGSISIFFMYTGNYWWAGFFLILKSILDAADGELARLKNTPSYTGRYLDSVADIILNMVIFITLHLITNEHFIYTILAFLGIQLQGTLYNYYYVILRNSLNGDNTSRIFEDKTPIALKGEKQHHVNILFRMYKLLYGGFDKTIYGLDKNASHGTLCPKLLMTAVSTFGLGFQLLIISCMLIIGWKAYIIPFFIGYTFMIFVFIAIRKML
jgi:hypothetical protein